MEEYFLYVINNFNLITIMLAAIVFLLTMIIKVPIKLQTTKLAEEKRKAYNLFIMLIPIALSVGAQISYDLILNKSLKLEQVLFGSINISIASFVYYIVYEKLVILVKAITSGKINVDKTTINDILTKIASNAPVLSDVLNVKVETIVDSVKKAEDLINLSTSTLGKESLDAQPLSVVNLDSEGLQQEIAANDLQQESAPEDLQQESTAEGLQQETAAEDLQQESTAEDLQQETAAEDLQQESTAINSLSYKRLATESLTEVGMCTKAANEEKLN